MPDAFPGTKDTERNKSQCCLGETAGPVREKDYKPLKGLNLTLSTAGSCGEVYAWEEKTRHLCTSDPLLYVNTEGCLEAAPWRQSQSRGYTFLRGGRGLR